jgi:cysteine desulfurase
VDRIYLDFNATSPLSTSVSDWLKSGEVVFANPSSQHSAGKSARKVINESRSYLFNCFRQSEKDTHLFFHSGATEAFCAFAHSFSEWARLEGKDLLICYSKLDHPAVTSLSERYFGPQVKFYELKLNGLEYDHETNFEAIKDKKDNNPDLLILYHHLWVHNETGGVSSLGELSQFKTIPDLYLHVDAVQAPGKVSDWNELKVGDIFSFSAHKFGALKGVGFSFFSKKISFHPLISGGGQQGNLRSGTENPMGVQSVMLALKDLSSVDVLANMQKRKELEMFLQSAFTGIGELLSTRCREQNANTLYFYIRDLPSDIALALFDLQGLMLSAGSACSSGAAKPSTLMTHLGYKNEAKNGLRLSFGFNLSSSQLSLVKERFQIVCQKIKAQ